MRFKSCRARFVRGRQREIDRGRNAWRGAHSNSSAFVRGRLRFHVDDEAKCAFLRDRAAPSSAAHRRAVSFSFSFALKNTCSKNSNREPPKRLRNNENADEFTARKSDLLRTANSARGSGLSYFLVRVNFRWQFYLFAISRGRQPDSLRTSSLIPSQRFACFCSFDFYDRLVKMTLLIVKRSQESQSV